MDKLTRKFQIGDTVKIARFDQEIMGRHSYNYYKHLFPKIVEVKDVGECCGFPCMTLKIKTNQFETEIPERYFELVRRTK